MNQSEIHTYEKSLLFRLIEDDEEAFCEIYMRYKSRLLYFAMKFGKTEEFAEDICHDTFIVLWQNRHFLDPLLSLSSYLYTIAKNRTLYVMRKLENEDRIKGAIMAQAIDYNEETDDTISVGELEKILSQTLQFLTGRQREVFEMSREKGMSHKQIADTLGISVYTVQEHISSALKTIHAALKKYYGSYSIILFLFLVQNLK